MTWKDLFFLLIVMIACLLAGFLINATYFKGAIPLPIYSTSQTSLPLCENLSLVGTANCLQSELSLFYHYNSSQVGKSLNESQLKQDGGVCSHYSNWYAVQAKSLGFYADVPIIQINETNSHQIAIISNQEGWCALDQTDVRCWEFGA